MPPKMRAYVLSYDHESKWMNFLIKDVDLLKNVIIFGIKPVIILKKNLIANPSTIKGF